jgi:hypothetical protein
MLLVTAASPPARGCQRPPPVLDAVPRDGSIGVATDVVPVYDLHGAQISSEGPLPQTFELTSEHGDRIALTARRSYAWHAELVPSAPLAPRTRYVLSGRWHPEFSLILEVTLSLTFTTGDGPLAATPGPPKVSMEQYSLVNVQLGDCDLSEQGTCLSFPADTMVEVTYIDSLGQSRGGTGGAYLYSGPFFDSLSPQGISFDCVTLRRRAENGTHSEPVTLCGKDAPHRQLTGSARLTCTPAGLALDGKTVGDQSDRAGCSVAGSTSAAWPWLGVLVWRLGRRRAR